MGSDDGVLVMTCDSWLQASRLLRGGDTTVGLRTLADQLSEVGATVRLDTATGPLLTLGAGVSPGIFGRLIGLRHLRATSAIGLWRSSRVGRTAGFAILGLSVAGLVRRGRRRRTVE